MDDSTDWLSVGLAWVSVHLGMTGYANNIFVPFVRLAIVKTALVLGGGGLPALGFHAAALVGLETRIGWDPRSADVILGTSAGALTGSLLRMGVSSSDLASFVSGAPLANNHFLVRSGAQMPQMPNFGWRNLLPHPRTSRMPSLRRLKRSPVNALSEMLPDGEVEMRPHFSFLGHDLGDTWPQGDLRICAVDDRDRLVVWDSQGGVSLIDAVTASTSIPGYAVTPVIDGSSYLDGGLRSPTNADALIDDDLDVAVILSPMTPGSGSNLGLSGTVKFWASRQLSREVRMLKGRGVRVVVLRSPAAVGRAALSPFRSMRSQPAVAPSDALLSGGGETEELDSLLGRRDEKVVAPVLPTLGRQLQPVVV